MIYGYIYKTTNLLNNKVYIGRKKGNFDKTYFGSGLSLKRSIKKYGISNFDLEIIAKVFNKNDLNELERKYIEDYRKELGRKNLYNISNGGEGGHDYPHSKKTRIKMSISAKGKKKSPEHCKNIGLSQLGRKQSRETCEKRNKSMLGKNKGKFPWCKGLTKETSVIIQQASIKRSGRKCSDETKNKIRQKKLAYKFTEEHRKNIGLSGLGRIMLEETRKKISKTLKNRKK